jgi:hypothetical protein
LIADCRLPLLAATARAVNSVGEARPGLLHLINLATNLAY